jgi:predicted phosphoribosyltransferase
MFTNREHAGKLLARKVTEQIARLPAAPAVETIVIGLPRGGVPVAAVVAKALGCKLTILVSKKIGCPNQPEYAVGAVSSAGVVAISRAVYGSIDQWRGYINREAQRLVPSTAELEQRWLREAGIQQVSFAGKRCILVDDGIATGMTTWAAIETLRRAGAAAIIVAAPVMPASTKRELEPRCDAVVAIAAPEEFGAVGTYYVDFHQVDDTEMIQALRSAQLLSGQDKIDIAS